MKNIVKLSDRERNIVSHNMLNDFKTIVDFLRIHNHIRTKVYIVIDSIADDGEYSRFYEECDSMIDMLHKLIEHIKQKDTVISVIVNDKKFFDSIPDVIDLFVEIKDKIENPEKIEKWDE